LSKIRRLQTQTRRSARPDGSVLVRTYPATFLSERTMTPETHEWDQLTYAARGFMGVRTETMQWLVPPHRAIWVPAGVEHQEAMYAPVSVRSLFLAPAITTHLPREPRTFEIAPLLRELILHTCRLGSLDQRVRAQGHLIAVLIDQLTTVSDVPLQLPWPKDPRAQRAAELLHDVRSAPAVARKAGASVRTLERLFSRETGMSLGEWRRRCRLLQAMRLLARGESVTEVALDSGYNSTSAFVSAFKSMFGVTPGQYASKTRGTA
jgi:AraC-like DNA-binding protein